MRWTAAVIQIFTYVPQKREPAFWKTANLRRSRRLIEKHLVLALGLRLRHALVFGGKCARFFFCSDHGEVPLSMFMHFLQIYTIIHLYYKILLIKYRWDVGRLNIWNWFNFWLSVIFRRSAFWRIRMGGSSAPYNALLSHSASALRIGGWWATLKRWPNPVTEYSHVLCHRILLSYCYSIVGS